MKLYRYPPPIIALSPAILRTFVKSRERRAARLGVGGGGGFPRLKPACPCDLPERRERERERPTTSAQPEQLVERHYCPHPGSEIHTSCGVQVGNPGMNLHEQRAHFALWALLKSPLLVSADLRSISPQSLDILLAEELIAVNQDPLGVAGDLIWKQGPQEVRSQSSSPHGTSWREMRLPAAPEQRLTVKLGACGNGSRAIDGCASVIPLQAAPPQWSMTVYSSRFSGSEGCRPAAVTDLAGSEVTIVLKPHQGLGPSSKILQSVQVMTWWDMMRFGITAKVLAKCKLEYYRTQSARGLRPYALQALHDPTPCLLWDPSAQACQTRNSQKQGCPACLAERPAQAVGLCPSNLDSRAHQKAAYGPDARGHLPHVRKQVGGRFIHVRGPAKPWPPTTRHSIAALSIKLRTAMIVQTGFSGQ